MATSLMKFGVDAASTCASNVLNSLTDEKAQKPWGEIALAVSLLALGSRPVECGCETWNTIYRGHAKVAVSQLALKDRVCVRRTSGAAMVAGAGLIAAATWIGCLHFFCGAVGVPVDLGERQCIVHDFNQYNPNHCG